MTIEEIEKEILSLTEGQSEITTALDVVNSRQERFERASQMLIELMRKNQVRTADIEGKTSDLVELAHTHDGRLDSLEESHIHTDARLDALIDSQIQVNQRLDALGVYVREVTTSTKESMTQLEAFIAETARQVRALVEGRNGNDSKPTQ